MKNSRTILAAFCLLIFASCNHSSITFKGTLKDNHNQMIYLSQVTTEGVSILDSSTIKNGKFSFKIKAKDKQAKQLLAEPAFYRISFNTENAFTTIAKAGDKLTINATADSLVKTYTIKGASDAELVQQLDHQLKLFADTAFFLETCDKFIAPDNDTLREKIEVAYMKIVDYHTNYLKTFIAKNMNSLASIVAFYQVYNRRNFFDETKDLALLKKIYSHLIAIYPNNENVQYLKQRIDITEYKKTESK